MYITYRSLSYPLRSLDKFIYPSFVLNSNNVTNLTALTKEEETIVNEEFDFLNAFDDVTLAEEALDSINGDDEVQIEFDVIADLVLNDIGEFF